MPHHITQRGNRRQQTFFNDGDYAAYLELMAEWCREKGVQIWSYCLMPNHVHLIAVPSAEDGLRWAIGEAHRRYTRRINFREKWRGYLWQGRLPGARDAVVGDDRRLASLSRQRRAGRGTPETSSAHANRSAAGRFNVCGAFAAGTRPHPCPAETRSETETRRELSYVSAESPGIRNHLNHLESDSSDSRMRRASPGDFPRHKSGVQWDSREQPLATKATRGLTRHWRTGAWISLVRLRPRRA